MSKYIRLDIRAEVSKDENFSPSDFILKLVEDLGSYAHVVYIPECSTSDWPASLTLADISGWDGQNMLIIQNTGNNPLSVFYESSNGPAEMVVYSGNPCIVTDFLYSTDITIQSSAAGETTFKSLLVGK